MKPRAGFTLIELMVAIALTLFIMVIMSQAFVMSLDTFSGMKGIGDMQINLRTAEVLLRDDLAQDHFTGKRRLSDPNFTTQPPLDGFFAVRRSSRADTTAYFVSEGNGDANGMLSYRAVDHMIYMTIKRKGNRLESFYNTALQGDPAVLANFFSQPTAYNVLPTPNAADPRPDLPNSTWAIPYGGGPLGYYAGQWAEVVYFLVQTGTTESPIDPTGAGTPTFGLYRAQFVMVPDGTNVSTLYKTPAYTPANLQALSQSTFSGLSCNPVTTGAVTALTFFSPADAASSAGLRVIPDITAAIPSARVAVGATLVCPNVISFQVHVMPAGSSSFDDAVYPPPALFYDTTKFGVAGYPSVGLKAIQVTLRVWDFTTKQTRQATFVQDL